MPVSDIEKEYVSYIVDLMQSIGPVSAKAMFGGYGIFLDGLMFALVADNVLYLKADKETENEFKVIGLGAFSYSKKGKLYRMSFYQAPDEALENEDEMSIWANKAYATALRAVSKKTKKLNY